MRKLEKIIVLIRHKTDLNEEKLKKTWLVFDNQSNAQKYFAKHTDALGFVYDFQVYSGRLENNYER